MGAVEGSVLVEIDGGIEGQRLLSPIPDLAEQRQPDGLLSIDAIAEAYWTQELDRRPWAENF